MSGANASVMTVRIRMHSCNPQRKPPDLAETAAWSWQRTSWMITQPGEPTIQDRLSPIGTHRGESVQGLTITVPRVPRVGRSLSGNAWRDGQGTGSNRGRMVAA